VVIDYPFVEMDRIARLIQELLGQYHRQSSTAMFSGDFKAVGKRLSDESDTFMSDARIQVLPAAQKLLGQLGALIQYDDKTIRNRLESLIKEAKRNAENPVNPLGYNELAAQLMFMSGQLKVRPIYAPKVFVGHSFRQDDQQIVKKFLDLFKYEGFECETGERPEANDVDEKVKRRINENEGLIIIGTKDQQLHQGQGWTLPPWLIGEHAYAMGLGKPTLLFFEDATDQRQRKGIQGDYEHILFNRDDPSEAIIKAIPYLQDFKQKIIEYKGKANPTSTR
jgi:hypothetical protein